jgi:hypothetical protein
MTERRKRDERRHVKRAYTGIVLSGFLGAAVACPACASILSLQDGVTVSGDASTSDGAEPTPDAQPTPDASLGEADASSDAANASGTDGSPEAGTLDARAATDATRPDDAGHAGVDAEVDASDAAAPDTGTPCASNLLNPMAAASSPMAMQPANSAIDGLLTTRWESAWGIDPQWIDADFNQPVMVNRVEVLWETACAADYTLEVSDDPDAGTWTTLATVTGNAKSDPNPIDYSNAVSTTGFAGVGRYLRVNGYIRCEATYGYSIWEIRAYGDTNTACTP